MTTFPSPQICELTSQDDQRQNIQKTHNDVPFGVLRHFTHKASVTSVHAEANAHSADWLMSTCIFVNKLWLQGPAPCTQSTRSVRAAVPKDYERDFTDVLLNIWLTILKMEKPKFLKMSTVSFFSVLHMPFQLGAHTKCCACHCLGAVVGVINAWKSVLTLHCIFTYHIHSNSCPCTCKCPPIKSWNYRP